jgi:hypothetical protein
VKLGFYGGKNFVTIGMAIIFYSRTMAHGIKNLKTEGRNVKHGIMSIAARILQANLKRKGLFGR